VSDISLFRRFKARIFTAKSLLAEERGNVESAMVMIPLILTFLAVLQISSFALSRGVLSNIVAGDVSRDSLLANSTSNLSNLSSLSNKNTSEARTKRIILPGGGSLLIRSIEGNPWNFAPTSLTGTKFTLTGISVDEN
jgi:hypothetical protein